MINVKYVIPYNGWNIHELYDGNAFLRIKIKDKIIIPIKIFGHPYLITPTISLEPFNEQAISDICIHYPNERMSRNLILPILEKDDIFIDVGAMYGSWSLPAAALGANVIAIEPNEDYSWILENQRNFNNFRDKITIINDEVVNINSKKLDYIMNVLSIDRCRLIKIDVEGAELDVLKSAFDSINRYLPNLLVELHGGEIEEYLQWFESNISTKYRYFVMDQRVKPDSAKCYHVYHYI